MSFHFEKKKAINVTLFLIHSLGGSADISRLFLLLYLADAMHLSKYGLLISGDSYVAMKYGPAPYNLVELFRQLQADRTGIETKAKVKVFLAVDDMQQVSALLPYNSSLLAASEVRCMYESLRQYKNTDAEALRSLTTGSAWQQAKANGEISLLDIAAEFGASAEMTKYISSTYKSEIGSLKL
ncbi:MAG: Panacea domain-containing protein [Bacteroidota bacterium]